MQNQLAEFSLGRIVLHLLCACQDHKFQWHWRGIFREIRKDIATNPRASLLIARCDRDERRTSSSSNWPFSSGFSLLFVWTH